MIRFIRMVFLFSCIVLSLSDQPYSFAQEYPVFEGFLGASASNNDFGDTRHTMPGWHFSLGLNMRHNLRFVGEFAGQHRNTNIRSDFSEQQVRLDEYQFLFGPEYMFYRFRQTMPFLHVLLGVSARHYNIPSVDPQHPRDVLAVDYGFASGFGGGLDIALSRHWAVRPLQFDYVLTNLSHDQPQFSPIQEQLPSLAAWQHNYRLSFGMVLRLGTRTKKMQ